MNKDCTSLEPSHPGFRLYSGVLHRITPHPSSQPREGNTVLPNSSSQSRGELCARLGSSLRSLSQVKGCLAGEDLTGKFKMATSSEFCFIWLWWWSVTESVSGHVRPTFHVGLCWTDRPAKGRSLTAAFGWKEAGSVPVPVPQPSSSVPSCPCSPAPHFKRYH